MSDYEDDQFEQSGSGASLTYPKQCSALRKNEFVMIKGKACKIVDMSTSKTGKHGHAKVHLVALDIFGKFYIIWPNFYSWRDGILHSFVIRIEFSVCLLIHTG